MFGDSSCSNQDEPTEIAACQTCDRRLSVNININNRIKNRILQEGGGDTVAPFATTIKISTTTANEDTAAAAAASPPFFRRTATVATLVVVAIGFFSSLMVIM